MYAQMPTSASVRHAPANPDSKILELMNAGKTVASAGITYVAARSAIIPARKPRIATKAKILNLSPISFTFLNNN
jgi:hypothetical protein